MTIKISNRPTVRAGLLMAFAITSSLLSGCETEKQPAGGHSDRQPPASGELMLSDTQIRLANITTRAVRKDAIGQTIVINGKLTVDEQRAHVISSRAGGRIEKLFFKETGQVINAGEPVYVLYSESLLTLQQEYLLAKEQFQSLGQTEKRYASFFEAAERKLLLYGLSRNQIRQLDKSSLQPRITFLSPASGIVTDINVSEGQYVAEGTMLYRLQDVRKLWVEAELYPHETRLVRTGDRVTVKIGGADEERIEAIVS
ncbi:MAG TPA: efflux RND transporter periplasmic adaptor subunit, partial [Chryseosolibacter sp.]|nr:efflux RND transporter periplasmic adaptor subunit [Chryseosolibacter sp.]